MTAETSQTLDRGLKVLKLLADTDHGLTVTELAAELGVNRTVVYRLLATLEQHSLVRRDLGGRARVGLGVLGLAHQVHPLLREAALPALRSLAEDIGATAHLTLVDGGEALAVAVVEPTWTDYHVAYRTGFRHPLDRGAAGRAILAGRRMQPAADGNGWEGCTDGYAEDGANGADGADGASSANGASGADGASSANGASGAGDVSSANGANSADGASSANGADSASSVNGVNGVHSVHRAYSSHSGYSKPGAGHFTAPADGTDRTIGPGGATNEIRYVLTHGELEAGASGAAAPLLGVPGIEGSVGVVMLAASVPERVGLRVVEAATEVADALR